MRDRGACPHRRYPCVALQERRSLQLPMPVPCPPCIADRSCQTVGWKAKAPAKGCPLGVRQRHSRPARARCATRDGPLASLAAHLWESPAIIGEGAVVPPANAVGRTEHDPVNAAAQ